MPVPASRSKAPRLFVEAALEIGAIVALESSQAHYLVNVLRLTQGQIVHVFNGRQGEWQAVLGIEGRRQISLVVQARLKEQTPVCDLLYLFAPLKHARLDYMVQKAVEMGVGAIRPVMTKRTQVGRVNLERMRANAIEAAEQCEILSIPDIIPQADLARAVEELESDRLLIFCDEEMSSASPLQILQTLHHSRGNRQGKIAVIVGPEGGFDHEERALLSRRENVARISLGPRILRADTAGVVVLTLIQATLGDWPNP